MNFGGGGRWVVGMRLGRPERSNKWVGLGKGLGREEGGTGVSIDQ